MISKRSFKGIKEIDLSDNTSVAGGGGTNTQTLQPPEGLCYLITRLWIEIPDPVGSGANDHRLEVYWDASFTTASRLLYCLSNFGSDISTNAGGLVATTEVPSSQNQQSEILTGIARSWASYDSPIYFLYTNNTDVAQAGTRTIKMIVEVWDNGV